MKRNSHSHKAEKYYLSRKTPSLIFELGHHFTKHKTLKSQKINESLHVVSKIVEDLFGMAAFEIGGI